MDPTLDLDFSVFGTRQAIDYLLGMDRPQRPSRIVSGIGLLLQPHYSLVRHAGGSGCLSDAEQASIRAGLAAAHCGEPAFAALNRAQDVFDRLIKAAIADPSFRIIDSNGAMLITPRFAILLHEARKVA